LREFYKALHEEHFYAVTRVGGNRDSAERFRSIRRLSRVNLSCYKRGCLPLRRRTREAMQLDAEIDASLAKMKELASEK
jgi:hypothetical protein